jgi:RNA polymerase sigma factor (sigma-70 family)
MIPLLRGACHAQGYFPQDSELEDFRQEISLLLVKNNYRRLRLFAGRSSPSTWLYRVAARYIKRHRRKQKEMVPLEDAPPDTWTYQPTQEEQLLFNEAFKVVLETVGKKSERKRKLFALLYWDELSPADIARVMGIKVATVHTNKHNLTKQIQDDLEKRRRDEFRKKSEKKSCDETSRLSFEAPLIE